MTGISRCGHIWKLCDRDEKIQAFREHIESNIRILDTDCWKWTGAICPRLRWGIFNCRGMRYRAQIAAHEVYCGPVIRGITVLNSCEERTCCNPDHLFIGSHLDFNLQYMKRTTDAKSWSVDAQGVTKIKDMLKNGHDTAHIAHQLNLPEGVVRRIQLRNKKDSNGS